MAIPKQQPLDERIKGVRAEAKAYIDEAANEEVKRIGGGVPFPVVRRCMVGSRDDLDAYLYLKAQEDDAKRGAA
jgi:hypothetical protein